MASYICYVAFLPHISESNPYKYIKMILLAAEKHKWKNFCYVWTSLGTQPYLDKLFRASSFPRLIAINPRSRSYRTLRRVDNFYIESFIRDAELGEAIKPLKSALVIIDREAGDESSRVKAEEISGVHHLTPSNFTKVLNSKGVVLVGFFYPEDAHSRALKHTWEKASRLLLGVVPVAAVDCTTFKSLTEEYEVVNNFPTIKVFVHGKFSKDYQGDIDEIAIAKFAFQQIVKLMKDRLPVEKKTKKTAFVPCIITAVLVMAGITFALYRETRTRALNTLAVNLNGASKRKKPKKKP